MNDIANKVPAPSDVFESTRIILKAAGISTDRYNSNKHFGGFVAGLREVIQEIIRDGRVDEAAGHIKSFKEGSEDLIEAFRKGVRETLGLS